MPDELRSGEETARVGPVVTTSLFNVATDQLVREVEKKISSDASRAAHSVVGWTAEQIRQSYMRGLRDGYAQGSADGARTFSGRPLTAEEQASGVVADQPVPRSPSTTGEAGDE